MAKIYETKEDFDKEIAHKNAEQSFSNAASRYATGTVVMTLGALLLAWVATWKSHNFIKSNGGYLELWQDLKSITQKSFWQELKKGFREGLDTPIPASEKTSFFSAMLKPPTAVGIGFIALATGAWDILMGRKSMKTARHALEKLPSENVVLPPGYGLGNGDALIANPNSPITLQKTGNHISEAYYKADEWSKNFAENAKRTGTTQAPQKSESHTANVDSQRKQSAEATQKK